MDTFLNLRVGALDTEVDAPASSLRHDLDRGLVQTVHSCFAFPLNRDPTPENLLADFDHAFLLKREHGIAEQDVLDAKAADQVLHFIDDVFRRPVAPLQTLPDGVRAVTAPVRAAAGCQHGEEAQVPRC